MTNNRSGLVLRKVFVGEGSQGSGLGGSCSDGRSSGGSDRGGRAGSCFGKQQISWIIDRYRCDRYSSFNPRRRCCFWAYCRCRMSRSAGLSNSGGESRWGG